MGLRERVVSEGPEALSDAELLAVLIGTGTTTHSVQQIAERLLNTFGGLNRLAGCEVNELADLHGVGTATAVRVLASLQLGRRSLSRAERRAPITTAAQAQSVLGPTLRALEDEQLQALFLDRRRCLIARRVLTRGSCAFTIVDPRQIYRVAVRLGASAILLAHNHPSGDPTPSAQDLVVTRQVEQAGQLLGIPLLDHLICGDGRWSSLAALGHLRPILGNGPVWTA